MYVRACLGWHFDQSYLLYLISLALTYARMHHALSTLRLLQTLIGPAPLPELWEWTGFQTNHLLHEFVARLGTWTIHSYYFRSPLYFWTAALDRWNCFYLETNYSQTASLPRRAVSPIHMESSHFCPSHQIEVFPAITFISGGMPAQLLPCPPITL